MYKALRHPREKGAEGSSLMPGNGYNTRPKDSSWKGSKEKMSRNQEGGGRTGGLNFKSYWSCVEMSMGTNGNKEKRVP